MLRLLALLTVALPAIAGEKTVTLKGQVAWPQAEAIPAAVPIAGLQPGSGRSSRTTSSSIPAAAG